MAGEADAFVLLILAWLLPPAAVALVAGCGADLCLNILLTLLAYLPGCIHAFWLVLRRAEANERYGRGNWIYKGMGEYLPRDPSRPGAQYPAPYGPGQAPPPAKAPPPAQAPVQTDAGSAPPPQAPADQKSGYLPPPAPGYQTYDAPPQAVPADQKAVEVVPADQKQAAPTAKTTAPPGDT